nr:phage tail protein [Herbaspirillum sp. ASV7]
MQVLERTGEDRDKRAALDAGSDAHTHPDREASSMADEALEIRASHMTAAAVAAAAVTAAVVTGSNAPVALQEGQVAPVAAEPQAEPLSEPQPSPALQRSAHDATAVAATPAASLRGALMVSLLTLGVIGLALLLSAQWPQRALKPMLQHLPGLGQATSVPAPAAPVPAVAAREAVEQAPNTDTIALLQQEADEKARLLAHKRALAEARHRREDEAQAQREQRRREAEAQLADARAKAERAQAAALIAPEIVEVPAAPTLAEQLRQCRALSLFARERCLWKLCDGKWGKDGCPSYEHDNEGA